MEALRPWFRTWGSARLQLRSIAFATSSVATESGKVTWDTSAQENYGLQLHYAGNILAGAISSKLQNSADLRGELVSALELIISDYGNAQASMYILVHAFLWDRFG